MATEKLVAVASTIEHTLFAFDPETGRPLWTFSANGPIDAPPTLGTELCWFGCRDGWVYAVRLTDGKLAWRRRVAPIEEWVVVDGQLESAWPLHGSPVVIEGGVYVAAGWHTGLDGGITVCALKAETGAMLWRRRFEKLPGDIDRANFPVSLLSSDGRFLDMGRFLALDPRTGERQAVATPTKALFFGQSSFRDTEWVQYSNTKGTLAWSVGRTQGNLLAFTPEGEVYGVAVAGDYPLWSRHSYSLFGRRPGSEPGWKMQIPLQVRAMVLARSTLFVAGWSDPAVPEIEDARLHDSRDYARAAEILKSLLPEQINLVLELWACSTEN